MMRITVNLARHPAENLRRVRIIWGGVLLLLLIGMGVLGATAWFGWHNTRQVQAQTAALRAQIAPLQLAAEQTSAPLNDAATRDVVARAQFLNQLIARKSVSWTGLFERLEQIQPPGVELISLRPLQRNGQNAVDLRFASDSLAPAIAFVQSLETSGDFSQAVVQRETAAPEGPNAARTSRAAQAPRFEIELTALYTPHAGPPAGAQATPSAGRNGSSGTP
ncbi:MAG: hypothetical protein ACRD1Y_14425 [Terriglobales bacterium]